MDNLTALIVSADDMRALYRQTLAMLNQVQAALNTPDIADVAEHARRMVAEYKALQEAYDTLAEQSSADAADLRRQLAEAQDEAYRLRSCLVTAIQESATLRQLLTDEQTRTEHLRRELAETQASRQKWYNDALSARVEAAELRRANDHLSDQLREVEQQFACVETCPTCDGDGEVDSGAPMPEGGDYYTVTCPSCNGRGWSIREEQEQNNALRAEAADLRRQVAEALGLPEDSAAAEIVSAARSLTEMLAAAAAEVQALRAALAADWPGVRAWLETAQETPEDAADWTPAHRPGKGDAR